MARCHNPLAADSAWPSGTSHWDYRTWSQTKRGQAVRPSRIRRRPPEQEEAANISQIPNSPYSRGSSQHQSFGFLRFHPQPAVDTHRSSEVAFSFIRSSPEHAE
jgi:hypothetical protein